MEVDERLALTEVRPVEKTDALNADLEVLSESKRLQILDEADIPNANIFHKGENYY